VKPLRFFILFFFVILPSSFLWAEETVFLDGGTFQYESVFSMNEDGITFETKSGLTFHAWKAFSETEADRLSGGKYHEYRELQAEKKERQEKQSEILKVAPELKPLHQVSPSRQKQKKPDFYSEKSPGPAQNANPVVLNKSGLAVPDLDRLIDFSRSIWTWSLPVFMEHQKGMGYLIRDQMDEGVEITRSYSRKLSFLDLQVWESMAVFKVGRLQELNFLLYNRGDADDLNKKEFAHLLEKIEGKITAWLGVQPRSLQDPDMNRNFKEENRIWTKGFYQFQLRWSTSQSKENSFSPEYVRLKITSFDHKNPGQSRLFTQESSLQKELTFYDLGRRVKKTENGDVLITGIPMVDQGDKGYCAVATAERVLRYYGRQVDQHQLAKLTGTSVHGGGTTEKEMMTTLYRISRTENVKIDTHYSMSSENFIKILKRYNKQAYKTKSAGYLDGMIDSPEKLFERLDDDLIKEIRLKERSNFEKFKDDIIRQSSLGIPSLWSVIIGIIPEKPEIPGYGDHLRLIIGFNLQTSELLYTDSWGPGHELKRMSFENAWTMTTGLYTIQPKHWNYSNTGYLDFKLGLNQKTMSGNQKLK
jgi:hypothetical protein